VTETERPGEWIAVGLIEHCDSLLVSFW